MRGMASAPSVMSVRGGRWRMEKEQMNPETNIRLPIYMQYQQKAPPARFTEEVRQS